MQIVLEMPFENQRDVLAIQQATLLPEPNMPAPVLFDIAYTTVNAIDLAFDEFSSWLDIAHERIEDVFEKGLTEQIKTTF